MAENPTGTSTLAQAFSRLTERERRLVSLLVGVFVLLAVVGGALLMSSALDKRNKRVSMRRSEIAQLEGLRGQYEQAVSEEKRNQSRIKNNTASLFSALQKNAGEVGLSLNDLNEKRTPVKDTDVQEVTVDVNLKDLSIDKLDTLLEKIEGRRADGVIKVTKMKARTSFASQNELLEVNMTVSTWKSSGTASEAPAAPGAPNPDAKKGTP